MNTAAFLSEQHRYFRDAYEQFRAFGGPCVYFHRECIRAGEEAFLSDRHLEMLYATLTAWGMHRMGDATTTKTKLTDWDVFRESLRDCRADLTTLKGVTILGLSGEEYSNAVWALSACYRKLHLSKSEATIVVNSKALYHLLPQLIPPIDRQYTVRFFTQPLKEWRNAKGKYQTIMLPAGIDAQFDLFQSICLQVKGLADRIDPALFQQEQRANQVTPPKAVDNAIVNFVRVQSGGETSAI
jgi:hypothetical protein